MEKDTLRRFIFENTDIRGEWVHLDETWEHLTDCADYPDTIKPVLGEALAAVALLSATIKYKGTLLLQINGSGALHLLLVQATSEGTFRGLARWNEEPQGCTLEELFGEGHLIITIEPSDSSERYQGIVSLRGERIADTLQDYFDQSEQLKTHLSLASDEKSSSGMLLQRLPHETTTDTDSDDWDRAVQLTNTLSSEELLTLSAETLLHRLFHEDDVRLFDAEPLCFKCSCSQGKVEGMVKSLGRDEANSVIEEQGKIEVNCEFCNKTYHLDVIDIERLFSNEALSGDETRH